MSRSQTLICQAIREEIETCTKCLHAQLSRPSRRVGGQKSDTVELWPVKRLWALSEAIETTDSSINMSEHMLQHTNARLRNRNLPMRRWRTLALIHVCGYQCMSHDNSCSSVPKHLHACSFTTVAFSIIEHKECLNDNIIKQYFFSLILTIFNQINLNRWMRYVRIQSQNTVILVWLRNYYSQ